MIIAFLGHTPLSSDMIGTVDIIHFYWSFHAHDANNVLHTESRSIQQQKWFHPK